MKSDAQSYSQRPSNGIGTLNLFFFLLKSSKLADFVWRLTNVFKHAIQSLGIQCLNVLNQASSNLFLHLILNILNFVWWWRKLKKTDKLNIILNRTSILIHFLNLIMNILILIFENFFFFFWLSCWGNPLIFFY